ncbi:hypothetical protein HK096_003780 [Nowakowskiella sp. JEL0078]|nr:hypothetical protein HK096_003780 [Nowakowskiella sp. JEL0078]
MAVDLFDIIDHLGIKMLHVLGFSLGGAVAQQLALLLRGRDDITLKSLVLIATFAEPPRSPLNRLIPQLGEKLKFPEIEILKQIVHLSLTENFIEKHGDEVNFLIDKLSEGVRPWQVAFLMKSDHYIKELKKIVSDLNYQFENLPDVVLPNNLLSSDVHLRDYQIAGVQWMRKLHQLGFSGILADEMGLGKTLQCITFLSLLKHDGFNGLFLIAVPLSLLSIWQTEFEKFSPHLTIFKYYGSKEERVQQQTTLSEMHDIFLTTYESCNNDKEFIKSIHFNFIIVDEAQRLKNRKSLLFHSLNDLNCKSRLLITGTPIQNNLAE